MPHGSLPCLNARRVHAAPHACAADDRERKEIERAQRRRDEAARRSEQEGADSSFDESSLDMLRERIDLIETKETNISEMKDMLRAMEPGVGIRFVGDDDEILATAWVFVALNVLVALWALKSLVVDPAVRSAGLF